MARATSLYVEQSSGLHRLHPLTKLALAALVMAAGLALPGVAAAYAVFAVLVVPLALWGRVLRPLLGGSIKAVLPFAISLFLIQGFFWTEGTAVLQLGPLSLKREGLLFAAASAGRILIIVSSFLLVTLTTRPDALMIALSQAGVPSSVAYIILSTIQIIPRFQSKANTILDAQQSRGLETTGRFLTRVRALLPLIQPLILGSIIDIEERAIALEARAFGRSGPKSNLLIVPDSAGQRLLRWLLLLAAVATIAGRFIFW
jgi:energy-coupling factor transport system permease protein